MSRRYPHALTARLSEPLAGEVLACAEHAGVSVSEWIRDAVEAYLDRIHPEPPPRPPRVIQLRAVVTDATFRRLRGFASTCSESVGRVVEAAIRAAVNRQLDADDAPR